MKYPKYADEAAFPRPVTKRVPGVEIDDVLMPEQWGLTKLEFFTALAMNGLAARGTATELIPRRALQLATDQLAKLEDAQS